MRYFLSLALVLLTAVSLRAQYYNWVIPLNDGGYGITTDALGNTLKAGMGVAFSDGWSLEKYAPNGQLLWSLHDGGNPTLNSYLSDVAVAPTGDIYAIAKFGNGANIGGTAVAVSGLADYAVVKYNSQGQLQWYQILTGAANGLEELSAISLTSAGNIVVQGDFASSCTFAGHNFSGSGSHIFWGIFDPSGNTLGMHMAAMPASNAWDSELDAAGNLLVVGRDDALAQIALFNFDLNAASLNWAFRVPMGAPQFNALTQDGSGNIYITGNFADSMMVGGTTYYADALDAYVLKVNPSGSLGWFRQLGGPSWQNGTGITTHANGDIYLTGIFAASVDFDGTILTSTGGFDIFFTCMDGTGQCKWATNCGNSYDEYEASICYDTYGKRILATGPLGPGTNQVFGPISFSGVYAGFLLELVDSTCQVSGRVFRDDNQNGTQDTGEMGIPNRMVRIQPGFSFANSDTSGHYGIQIPFGSHTVDMPSLPLYYSLSTPASYSVNFTASGQSSAGNDFGLYPIGNVNDLRITATSTRQNIRASAINHFTISYTNVGTTLVTGAAVTFAFDSLTYVTSAPLATSVAPGLITWALPQLNPGDQGTLEVDLQAPNLTLGGLQALTARITPNLGDATPLDNVDSLAMLVVNSFDPNRKDVFPIGPIVLEQVIQGEPLHYTIRFQNTGNDTAYFVRLRDTLSPLLDLATFMWVAESHPAVWTIDANRILTVDFYNINLLDSTSNEAESHGFFRYSAKPISTAQEGDVIENTAHIYFDFNPPIVTNTTSTLIIVEVAVDPETPADWLQVYPNPAQGQLNFACKRTVPAEAKVELWDGMGRNVGGCTLMREGAHVDVSQLPAGIYAYRVVARGDVLARGKVVVSH